jgi:plasmid stabilization system protein ParE
LALLIYSRHALADLDRLADFLRTSDPDSAHATAELIIEAIDILANHPLVGRPVEDDVRELVISRGKSGYLALYSYEVAHDAVLILAVRHQREAGYAQD